MIPNQFIGMLNQLKANPLQFAIQRRFNLPNNIGNDPDKIIQHLLNSGQVSQQQINAAYQMMGQFHK